MGVGVTQIDSIFDTDQNGFETTEVATWKIRSVINVLSVVRSLSGALGNYTRHWNLKFLGEIQ